MPRIFTRWWLWAGIVGAVVLMVWWARRANAATAHPQIVPGPLPPPPPAPENNPVSVSGDAATLAYAACKSQGGNDKNCAAVAKATETGVSWCERNPKLCAAANPLWAASTWGANTVKGWFS